MTARVPPKAMAKKLMRLLRSQHPDYHYLKKVFQHTRALLEVGPAPPAKRLPVLLTDVELQAFCEAVWTARQLTHVVLLKLLLFTGLRNAELVSLRLVDVDLQTCQLRIVQDKGHKDRQQQRATYLFESNRHRPYSTRRLHQIVTHYARVAGIEKRVYPHLFRHQLMTYLTKRGIISPKLQLLSGHAAEQSLAVYRVLTLSDVAAEYEEAMKTFPVR